MSFPSMITTSNGSLGFEWWLGEDWSRWLNVLPKLWSDEGNPCVPWLLPIAEVKVIEVVFCCNLHILCDSTKASALLRRSVLSQFEKNPAVAGYLKDITVNAELMTTVGIAFSLSRSIARRIEEEGYGRRFGDPFKDMFRELHRYLRPYFDRIPCDASGAPLGLRKEPFAADLRKQTALGLLDALGVSSQEIQSWFAATST